jgi:hypothetical protein
MSYSQGREVAEIYVLFANKFIEILEARVIDKIINDDRIRDSVKINSPQIPVRIGTFNEFFKSFRKEK